MILLNQLRQYIEQKQLFENKDKLLLAVSGGLDSVVMLDLMYSLGYRLGIAHANFGLRNEDSEKDEEFVRDLANKYAIPFFTKKFDTISYKETHKLSVQLAARQLRYDWFETLLKEQNYHYLLTAHHLNDQLETILYNLAKGTGIAGLRGIRPKIKHIVRPMLFADRQQILEYAQNQELSWREDISNESDKYSRNLIRHHIVPVLKELNPSVEQTVGQSAERLLEMETWFDTEMNLLENKLLKREANADFLNFGNLLNSPQALISLHHLLKKYNFNYAQSKEILGALNGLNGKKFESFTHILVKQEQELVITVKNELVFETQQIQETTKHLEVCFSEEQSKVLNFEIKESQGFKLIKKSEIACLDFDKLVFPLTLRTWKDGDFFVPLGMKGKKKVSDLLNELKIPNNLKHQVLVLCSADQIVWVVGYRINENFKFTKQSNKVYQISYA